MNGIVLKARQLIVLSLIGLTTSACRSTETSETNLLFSLDPLEQAQTAVAEHRFTLYSINIASEPLPGVDLNLMAISRIEAECGIHPVRINGKPVESKELTSEQLNFVRLYNRTVFKGCWTFMKDYQPRGK